MPSYNYRLKSGEIVERFFSIAEVPQKIRVKGKGVAVRDYTPSYKLRNPGAGWPFACWASGVNPNQAQELRDHFQKCGVRCDVNNDGDPVYENAAQRKAALKCRGLIDRSSFC